MPSHPEPPEYDGPPRHGLLSWLVFLGAIAAVLAVCVRCTAWMYAPVFGG
ncbi:hypothetical protein [Thermobifida cellulosilytica]|nr:hypothetical protein [Thermobifida cellulosilytica]